MGDSSKAESELGDLFRKHSTDKHYNHHYERMYAEILAPFRKAESVKLLEIGIAGGNSLKAWRDWFTNGRLFGIDIKSDACQNAPAGVTAFCGDQADTDFLARVIAETGGNFDAIIDDGGHGPAMAEDSFAFLWTHLSVGGVYVIEDLDWSRRTQCELRAQQLGRLT